MINKFEKMYDINIDKRENDAIYYDSDEYNRRLYPLEIINNTEKYWIKIFKEIYDINNKTELLELISSISKLPTVILSQPICPAIFLPLATLPGS